MDSTCVLLIVMDVGEDACEPTATACQDSFSFYPIFSFFFFFVFFNFLEVISVIPILYPIFESFFLSLE